MAPPPVCFMKGTAWRVVMTMDLRSISMTRSQTVEIDIHQRLVAVEPQHAGGVDDVVEAAGLVKGVGDGLVDEGLLGDVADQVERAINRQIGRPLPLDVDHGDAGAAGDEITGDVQAHAAAGAGDDRGLVGEGHVPAPDRGDRQVARWTAR